MSMINYNFEKFIDKNSRKKGLRIGKNTGYIKEEIYNDFDSIDIFIDTDKKAIKIVSGDTRKLTKARNTKTRYFSTSSLVKYGKVEIGKYRYIGDNIFIKE